MAKNQSNVAAKTAQRTKKTHSKVNWVFPLSKQNFIYLGIGLATIIVGYLLMSTGLGEDYAVVGGRWMNPLAVDVAPVVLLIGYCVIIPYAIYKYFGNTDSSEEKTNS